MLFWPNCQRINNEKQKSIGYFLSQPEIPNMDEIIKYKEYTLNINSEYAKGFYNEKR